MLFIFFNVSEGTKALSVFTIMHLPHLTSRNGKQHWQTNSELLHNFITAYWQNVLASKPVKLYQLEDKKCSKTSANLKRT